MNADNMFGANFVKDSSLVMFEKELTNNITFDNYFHTGITYVYLFSTDATGSYDFDYTITSNNDRFLFFSIYYQTDTLNVGAGRGPTEISSITCDDNELIKIFDNETSGARFSLWYMIDPPSGVVNMKVSFFKYPGAQFIAVYTLLVRTTSYYGVNQANPYEHFYITRTDFSNFEVHTTLHTYISGTTTTLFGEHYVGEIATYSSPMIIRASENKVYTFDSYNLLNPGNYDLVSTQDPGSGSADYSLYVYAGWLYALILKSS
jgi:hypothetical protein